MVILNGWQRVGVVFTVLWVLTVSGFAAYEYAAAAPNPDTVFRPRLFVGFSADAYLNDEPDTRMLRVGHLVVALAVIPTAAWLLVDVVIRTTRWVRAGFRNSR